MHKMMIRGGKNARLTLRSRSLKRAAGLAGWAAILVGSLAPMAATAQIYATAYDGVDTNFFFAVTPGDSGAAASGFGHVLLGPTGPDHDSLPLTAMSGIGGHLKATSLSKGGTFDYYSDIAPQPDGSGGYTFNNGSVSEFENGIPLTEPVGSMAALGGVMLATSWTGTTNYFFELHENSASFGAFGDNFGGITLGEGGSAFGYEVETMASYGGQLYGTAFDGEHSLFFRLNLDADGTGAWIDGLGFLEVSGVADTDRVDAMVGGKDGLYATSWNDNGNYNYLFRIDPDLDGSGGTEVNAGAVTLDGAKIPFRINALGYVFSSALPDTPAVPEPASWAMMLAGFGAVGFALRRRSVHNYALVSMPG